MNRRYFLAGLGVLGTMMLAGCGKPSMPTYRYRLTVEVDTPEGLRTGSSVIEVTNQLAFNINVGGYSFFSHARGEAVAVDLPGNRTIFALLRGEDGYADWAARIVYDLATPVPISTDKYGSFRAEQLKNAVANRAVVTVPRTVRLVDRDFVRYPLLVTFTDIHDPKTVTRVDPADLAASFGLGIKLRRITVQITDDPVTTGIEKRLGWLEHLDQYRTDPSNPFTNTLPTEIGGLRSNSK